MSRKPIINPITGKADTHTFKMQKKAKKQTNYDLKKERILSDNTIMIIQKVKTEIMDVLTEESQQTKSTVLHTKTMLLPSLANTRRTITPYAFTLAENKTELVCQKNEIQCYQNTLKVA